jgi:acyl-CoA synthetase (AMP-forming)/AMP-acid ligase II
MGTSTTSAVGAAKSVTEWVADFLIAHGADRIYGLQGGHIQPIWDWLGRKGVRIIDVRDEGASVHMAHADAVLTEDAVLDFCRDRMAGYKRPRSVSFIREDEMPRTATGKILHRRLRERFTR